MVFLDRLGSEQEDEIGGATHHILGSYTAFKAGNLQVMRHTPVPKQSPTVNRRCKRNRSLSCSSRHIIEWKPSEHKNKHQQHKHDLLSNVR